jgi:hypothetical protein
MPKTVKAKLLLGWMRQHEAVDALNACVFDEYLTRRKAIALWKRYRDKVAALEPRNPAAIETFPFTDAERQAVEDHRRQTMNGPNAQYFSEVIKVRPGDLLAHQYSVLTERAELYGQVMQNEHARINNCLGVGQEFRGQLVHRQVSRNRVAVDLPHFEYLVIPTATGIKFQERDRYIVAVRTPGGRLLLWGGYHRVHAVLCHTEGDGAGTAPLLTVMTGAPDVERFFVRPSPLRDTVLGDRPALVRDFLDEDLFITVNLRKKRAEGRVEQIRPGKFRAGVFLVDDES